MEKSEDAVCCARKNEQAKWAKNEPIKMQVTGVWPFLPALTKTTFFFSAKAITLGVRSQEPGIHSRTMTNS
jgi:hypothetical protein